jgi:DNA-binding CsgD family transcriptional regulator
VIIGRAAELNRCDRVLADVGGGRAARLLVIGDVGFGKSALLDTVCNRARRRHLRALRLVGVEGEDDLPYALLDEVMTVLGAPPAPQAARVSRRSALLVEALTAACTSDPVLLLLDDAQFVDPESLAAFVLALRLGDDLPVGVILTSWPDAQVECRFVAWPRLDVGPLDPGAALAVLRSELADADPVVLARLAAALGGNPLALHEVRHLLTGRQIRGLDPLPDPLPLGPALHQAWRLRLDRLGDSCRFALLDLAVAGGQPVLRAAITCRTDRAGSGDKVSSEDPGESPRAAGDHPLVEASQEGLIRQDPVSGPSFTHPLLRAAVLGRTSPPLLNARHRLAADTAAEADLPPAVVVHHLVRSCNGPDAAVADAIDEQAERAERLERFHEAVHAWFAAARLSLTPHDRVRRAIRGIRRQTLFDTAFELRAPLLDLVDGQPLDPEAACLVECLRAGLRADHDPQAALATRWSAVAHAREAVPQLLPALLVETAHHAWGIGQTADGTRAAREFAEVDALPGQNRDSRPPWTATALLAAALFQEGHVAAATPLRRQAIEAASDVDPARLDLDALLEIVFIDDLLLDLGAASGHRLLVATERLGREAELQACLWGIQAWRARARGDWAIARAMLDRGRPIAEASRATWPELGMTALAVDLAAACADDDVLRAETQRLRATATRIHDVQRLATLDRALGLRALVDGRLEAAIAALTAAADRPFLGRGLRDGVLTARVDLVEALVRAGQPAAARERTTRLHPLLAAMDEPLAHALDARIRGLVAADYRQAEALYTEAIALHEDATEPFERGRSLLLLGETLRRARRRTRAKVALTEAVECFVRLGATPLRLRAEHELRAAGGAPLVAASPAAAVLTAQELAVARETASGKSNREVAASLFLSPRTVEYHLANVYRKLGIRGRGGLAHGLAALEPAAPQSPATSGAANKAKGSIRRR